MNRAKGAWILLGIVWIGLYWPLLTGQVPAFRDAYHFYYPLEHWLGQQAQQGDIFPQFNPLDGVGANLVGEMSTGLFYPGRILWWLPTLSVPQRLAVVLLVHTAIAGVGAAQAARRMNLNAAGQLLAATAYSLSGPVLFQHVNPIYLISSAWLPWVLGECWVMALGVKVNHSNASANADASPSARDVRWGRWGTGCCLMLLGGDPQSTLHCGLISLLAILIAAWSSRCARHAFKLCARLSIAVLVVSGLTAVQTLPTFYWYRATAEELTSVTDEQATDPVPALLRAIPPTDYDLARGSPYAFSVAPWHLLTLLWTNSQGHVLPDNARYLAACSAEPRMWTPSLSIGLAALLLALGCFFHRETRRSSTFLWLTALLSGTAMLGNYAPAWLLRNLLGWLGLPVAYLPGDEVGGTYWLLTQLVPGYESFRYPAKWTPLFALSLSLCAAQGLDQFRAIQKVFFRSLLVVAGTTWMLFLTAVVWTNSIADIDGMHAWLNRSQPDGWLGAIDPSSSIRTIVWGFTLPALVSLSAIIISKRTFSSWQPWCLVLVVMLELACAANQWLVTASPPQVANALPSNGEVAPTRFWAAVGQANLTNDVGGHVQLDDKLRYQQQFGLAKLHLLSEGRANLSAFMTLTPRALARVRHQLARHDQLEPKNAALDEALAWMGVQWRLVRSGGLHWQPIDHAAPMMVTSGSANTLHVNYLRAAAVRMHVRAVSRGTVTVRLFQDGGWTATLRDATSAQDIVPKSSHLGLFQSFDVSPGDWDIELRYQAPGLQLGAWITGLSIVVSVGTQFLRRKRRLGTQSRA